MSPALRRLQWTLPLTAVFVTAAALAVAGTIAVGSDGRMRDARLAGQLETRAQVAATLVYYDSGRLVLDDLKTDDVAKDGPPIVVLTCAPPTREAFTTARSVPAANQLAGVAAEAASTEEVAARSATGPDGSPVRLTAAAFYDESGKAAGATVVVGDPGPAVREHRRMLAGLGMGGAGGLLVVAAGTSLLVGVRLRRAVADAGEAVPAPRQ